MSLGSAIKDSSFKKGRQSVDSKVTPIPVLIFFLFLPHVYAAGSQSLISTSSPSLKTQRGMNAKVRV